MRFSTPNAYGALAYVWPMILCALKNFGSSLRASASDKPSLISFWLRFFTVR